MNSGDKINSHIRNVEALQDFELSIFYKNEIEQQIYSVEEGCRFVEEGKVNIYKKHGTIANGDNGLLVNISALSLRELYDKYKDRGLFEQNFRYFVRNKKIDDQIETSLKDKRNEFWFLNNGIIIGCKDFHLDGDNVKLEKFSIVNGCQTTTILGSYKGKNEEFDFPIPCKIVKPIDSSEDAFNRFISEIAEASNSQKPISDRDLKSNQPEQRQLQRELQRVSPKVYMEIKRGEGLLRKRNLESWQKVKNEFLGQLILSVLLQQPGTARSNKKKIFADRATYNRIFKRRHDTETLIDLLKLSSYYDDFLKNKTKDLNENVSNVAKNGKLTILSIIGFLLKYKRKLVDISVKSDHNSWPSEVTSDNLSGRLFREDRPDDYHKVLNSLFNDLIMNLNELYQSRSEQETSVTNFFKTDKKYFTVILERVRSHVILDEYTNEKCFEKFSQVFKY